MKPLAFLALILAAAMLQACATAQKSVMRDDPLIGKIIDTGTARPLTFQGVMENVRDKDVIFLSEKHDNPMHHAIQHRIIQALIDEGRPPVLGFEFFSVDQTPLLLNFVESAGTAGHPPKMAAQLEGQMRKKLGWENQPDDMWAFYYKLLCLARDNGLVVTGLDLNDSQKRRITRKGLAGLTPIEKQRLFSTELSDPAYEAYMKETFKAVHCGMTNERMAARLYDTWLARNDRMALSLSQASPPGDSPPVVAIIGYGHTEYGLGIMDRLRQIRPDLTQVNIGLTEISVSPLAVSSYLEPLGLDGRMPAARADFLWFTQRTSYQDPCQKFKASLARMKKKRAASPAKDEIQAP